MKTSFDVRVNACNRSTIVAFADLPEASREYVIEYGLRQILNDAHVSEKEADAKWALVEKKLDALADGSIRVGASRTSDPVAQEIKRIAHGLCRAFFKKAGTKVTADFYSSDTYQAKWKEFCDRDTVREQAERNVNELAELAELEV